ncbi:hypothetical protein SRB5_13070 [Streptomyces sp. RB5]|uniref:Uncharacterized protein n=1 Tax=Streptomyces smaragdinus TaxID=2585196 RepID=A0A7K0CCX1_9ACTN|nr:hypothetical protein [Streptomyces smaragdinus]MQY11193.1 hypothetical protein [Streptomyces smaragdinus]
METDEGTFPLSPEQARAALADTDHIRTSVSAISATPWPLWFVTAITAMLFVTPIALGGVMAEPGDWLMPQWVWLTGLLSAEAVFYALFAVAAKRWRETTGVALRFDVLPKAATLPLCVVLPVIVVGSGFVFRETGEPLWLYAASALGAALSIGFHLWFVRLHGKTA